ncbi:TIGR03089 family protein [Calidifontibacter terrae]
MRVDQIVPSLLAGDPARPRVTFYDDADGPTRGERIELSGKVLANWVNKAANMLQEEFNLGPGGTVQLDLPAQHWRTIYWALAVWSVGGTLLVGGGESADLRISDSAPADVLVTLAALARSHPGDVGSALDEARELPTYGDRFVAWAKAPDDQPCLATPAQSWTYAELVASGQPERALVTGDLARTLRRAATLFAADGAVLLVRDPDPALMPDRLRAEGVAG